MMLPVPKTRTRNTRQRRTVLEAVCALAGTHPTAADVYAHVQTDCPQMSLATVYRALHALVEQQSVAEIRVESVSHYDAAPCAHHHVVCRRCGAIADVCEDALSPAALRRISLCLERASDFVLDTNPVQFLGICATCRA